MFTALLYWMPEARDGSWWHDLSVCLTLPPYHFSNTTLTCDIRCRWCPNGYCEDCLDWDAIRLGGDNVPEYKVLKFPVRREAYYITCGECNSPGTWEALEAQAETWAREAEEAEAEGAEEEAREVEAEIRERIVVKLRTETIAMNSPTESELDRTIIGSVEELVENIRARPRQASPTASPTPGLILTTHSTVEQPSPRTPRESVVGMELGASNSPTPSKRKNAVAEPGSHKKQKKNRYEIEV
jgi:hypothetical protein